MSSAQSRNTPFIKVVSVVTLHDCAGHVGAATQYPAEMINQVRKRECAVWQLRISLK